MLLHVPMSLENKMRKHNPLPPLVLLHYLHSFSLYLSPFPPLSALSSTLSPFPALIFSPFSLLISTLWRGYPAGRCPYVVSCWMLIWTSNVCHSDRRRRREVREAEIKQKRKRLQDFLGRGGGRRGPGWLREGCRDVTWASGSMETDHCRQSSVG